MDQTPYDRVMCVETGEVFDSLNPLPTNADTAFMRARYTYVFETLQGTHEPVKPCGGLGRRVSAYWRGEWGNPTRAGELGNAVACNARHAVP